MSVSRAAGRAGFTLIEIMIVVVIIGILAAMAIVRQRRVREAAYVATMKSDLRNFINAELGYYADSNAFSAMPPASFITSSSVTGPTITVSGTNVTAWVGSTQTSKTCAIFVGITPLAPAVQEAAPQCN